MAWENEPTNRPLPRLTPYVLSQVRSIREKLIEVIRFEFKSVVVTGEEFDRFVRLFREGLPSSCDCDAVVDSLRTLAGQVLTDGQIQEVCWRMAGNIRLLSRGQAAYAWKMQRKQEWAPLQIMSGRPEKRRGKPGYLFSFQVLAGGACPRVIQRWWSLRYCRFTSRKFGFTRRYSGQHPYRDPLQLVTLWLYGLIDPDLSNDEPVFKEISVPGSSMKWNRLQLKRTVRLEKAYACPRSYPLSIACHRCPIGYRQCPAGRHRENYTKGLCNLCEMPDAVFDAAWSKTVCVDCYRKKETR